MSRKKVTVANAYVCNGCYHLFHTRLAAEACAANCTDLDMFSHDETWRD